MALRDRLNPHFADLAPVDFAKLAARVEGEGLAMLAWADPFVPDPCLPPHVIEATKAALDRGRTHYTLPIGDPALRRAIAAKLARVNGLVVDPDRELIVTPGSDLGLWFAMQVLLTEGDEVLNPEPSYASNHQNAGLLGATSLRVPLDAADGWQLDLPALERAISPRTKLIVLTQPNNPTGTVHRRDRLEALARLAVAHDLYVVADHAFEELVFDGRELVTIATLPGMRERTIGVFSASKGLGLSGFRVGYNVASPDLMAVMHSAAVNVMGVANTFAQAGALAALEDSAYVDGFMAIYDARRKKAVALLGAIDGVRCDLPESGYLLWLDVSRLGTSAEVAAHLRQSARVIVSAGTNYGPSGEGYLRIMLGALRDEAAFDAVLARIAVALKELRIAVSPEPPTTRSLLDENRDP